MLYYATTLEAAAHDERGETDLDTFSSKSLGECDESKLGRRVIRLSKKSVDGTVARRRATHLTKVAVDSSSRGGLHASTSEHSSEMSESGNRLTLMIRPNFCFRMMGQAAFEQA